MPISENAKLLLEQRYCHAGESPEGVYKRVAKALAIKDSVFEKQLYNAMMDEIFFPNSPALRNAGKKKGCLAACFILPVEDSIESIFESVKNMATIFQRGGGVGINFSNLRPRGAMLSTGGTSSGAVSFMGIYDAVTETVKQGGFRRGALMGILNPDHPEIMDFCRAKLGGSKLKNFNISVLADDEFMKKAIKGGDVTLQHEGNIYGTARAKDIFDLICLGSWVGGDPALLFKDRINKDNRLYPSVVLDTTNPCQPGDALILDGDNLLPINSSYATTWTSWKTGVKEVLELTCNNGLKLRFTPEHKLMNENGEWIQAKDTLNKSIKWGLGNREASGVFKDIALAGFLFGDGTNSGTGFGVSVRINDENEPEVAEMLKEAGFKKETCGDYYINKEKLSIDLSFLEKTVTERKIPDWVLYGDSKTVKSFLTGFFEANGSCNKRNGQVSLKSTNKSLIENIQVLLATFGIPSWVTKNKPATIEWTNGTYTSKESYSLQIAPRNAKIFKNKIGFLSERKLRNFKNTKGEYKTELKVVEIRSLGEMEVWDFRMNEAPNYNFCQGVIAHNCSEVSLPDYGACVLGSINISKFVEGDKFRFDMFYDVCRMATRALLNMNLLSSYPLPQIRNVMQELNPIGVGIMGFADALIMLGIKYDSKECLDFIDQLAIPYTQATEEGAPDSFYKRIVAPTGSLSILANCSSSIEPVFDTVFQRNLTIGVIEETRDIYKSEAVRTAHQVSPEWHLKVQAKWQSVLDGGASKTINMPSWASVEDIKNIYIEAWKSGTKGVTVFRDGCLGTDGQVLVSKGKCEDGNCHL